MDFSDVKLEVFADDVLDGTLAGGGIADLHAGADDVKHGGFCLAIQKLGNRVGGIGQFHSTVHIIKCDVLFLLQQFHKGGILQILVEKERVLHREVVLFYRDGHPIGIPEPTERDDLGAVLQR